jgi:hypothetical protein
MTSPAAAWPPTSVAPIQALALAAATAAQGSPPTASTRLAEALKELVELETTFIVLHQPPGYSDQEFDFARAFVVLAHGVIEHYLEGIALETVDAPLTGFNNDSRPRNALLALLTYRNKAETPPQTAQGGPWRVREALKEARTALHARTRDNNGVKQKDVLSLLLPTGLKESDLSSSWLARMDDLGELRGRVVHGARRVGAQQPVTPDDALKTVVDVLPTLCRADARLVALRDE